MRPEISVVVPCYNEAENINATNKKIHENLLKITNNFEIIYVDDGSLDNTFASLFSLSTDDNRIKIVKLSRNFGHQKAIYAGLEKTSGKCIILIDADLQDPPEMFTKMYENWKAGYKVVYGVRKKREGSFLKLLAYSIYHKVFNLLSNIKHKNDLADFCLIDEVIKNHLLN